MLLGNGVVGFIARIKYEILRTVPARFLSTWRLRIMTNLHGDQSPKELREYTQSPDPYLMQDELAFLDFLIIIAQRKRLIAIITAVCMASAAAIALLLPEQYSATVVILPPQEKPSVSTIPASQVAGSNSTSGKASSAPSSKNLNDMYVAMLKSRSVEDAVIQRYGLMAQYHKNYLVEARKALEAHTKIDGSNKDGLIRLEFSDRVPARASEIANGYVEQFRNFSKHLALTEASQRRVVFETQLEKTKTDLENADEALTRTQLATGMVQVDSRARAMIDETAKLRAAVVAKQVQIEAMHSSTDAENPALAQAESELAGLRVQFAKLLGSKESSNEDLSLLKGNAPQAGLEYVRRLRDVRYYEAIFDILARQLELARLEEAKEGAFIQVVDPAVPPEKKSFPKRGLIIMSGIAVGFTFGLMFALLQGGLARMQHNPATRDKLTLLRGLIWIGKTARPAPVPAESGKVKDFHTKPEATG